MSKDKTRWADNLDDNAVEKLALADEASADFTDEYLASSESYSLADFVAVQELNTMLEPDLRQYFKTNGIHQPIPLMNMAIREYIQNHPM